jgi:hypothetical protein
MTYLEFAKFSTLDDQTVLLDFSHLKQIAMHPRIIATNKKVMR